MCDIVLQCCIGFMLWGKSSIFSSSAISEVLVVRDGSFKQTSSRGLRSGRGRGWEVCAALAPVHVGQPQHPVTVGGQAMSRVPS